MANRAWHRCNNILFSLIVVINGYVIAAPFWPNVDFWWQEHHTSAEKNLTAQLAHPTPAPQNDNSFHANATHDGLIIPKLLIDTPLIEGPAWNSFNLLNEGAWRLPFSSTPDKGSNTVIAGHRFSYTGPRGIFYFLNKLIPGDAIGLWYHGILYRYTVSSSTVHSSTDSYVENPTNDTRLTIYTCTPLWRPVNRLVIVAVPVQTPQQEYHS